MYLITLDRSGAGVAIIAGRPRLNGQWILAGPNHADVIGTNHGLVGTPTVTTIEREVFMTAARMLTHHSAHHNASDATIWIARSWRWKD